MYIKYDPQANAMRIKLNDLPFHHSHVVNDLMIVDLAEDGTPISVELLAVNRYVDETETVSLKIAVKTPG